MTKIETSRLIAAALWDFLGYLMLVTTDAVGSTANAIPMIDALRDWARLRGLGDIEATDSNVLHWQDRLGEQE